MLSNPRDLQVLEINRDTKPFDNHWKEAIQITLRTFKEQQRKEDNGPYSFQRRIAWANTLFGELLWETYTQKPHYWFNLSDYFK